MDEKNVLILLSEHSHESVQPGTQHDNIGFVQFECDRFLAIFTHHTWWTRKTTLVWDSELTEQCGPNYIGNVSEKFMKFVIEKSQGWQVHITLGFIHYFFTQPLLNKMDLQIWTGTLCYTQDLEEVRFPDQLGREFSLLASSSDSRQPVCPKRQSGRRPPWGFQMLMQRWRCSYILILKMTKLPLMKLIMMMSTLSLFTLRLTEGAARKRLWVLSRSFFTRASASASQCWLACNTTWEMSVDCRGDFFVTVLNLDLDQIGKGWGKFF